MFNWSNSMVARSPSDADAAPSPCSSAEVTLQAVLSAADAQIIVILDHERRITKISSGVTPLLGWSAHEVIGLPFTRFLITAFGRSEPDGSINPRLPVSSHLATPGLLTPSGWPARADLMTRDGLLKKVRLSSVELKDTHERGIGWAVVATDISLLAAVGQRLNDSEDQFRHSFDRSPSAMAVVCLADASRGRLKAANAAMEAFTGRSRDELLQLSMRNLLHPTEVLDHLAYLELAASTGQTEPDGVQRRFLHADGSSRWGRKTTGLMTPSSATDACLLVHVQDVTHQVLSPSS